MSASQPKSPSTPSASEKPSDKKVELPSWAEYLGPSNGVKALDESRDQWLKDELSRSWDIDARQSADRIEQRAARIVYKIREFERVAEGPDAPFGNNPGEDIPKDETRDMGGQFLTNQDRINHRSKLFDIAKAMPKGALHHLHLNAQLVPMKLIEEADKNMKQASMYIASSLPLYEDYEDAIDGEEKEMKKAECFARFANTEIQIAVLDLPPESLDSGRNNIFTKGYPGFVGTKPLDTAELLPGQKRRIEDYKGWMKWSDFREKFKETNFAKEELAPSLIGEYRDPPKWHLEWVRRKMVLGEDVVYSPAMTVNGIWARFNQGTRAFKGLLNYESAFSWYIGEAIEDMINDGIMYAELRPMWLDPDIPSDDATRRLDHDEQIRIIRQEFGKKHEAHKEQLEEEKKAAKKAGRKTDSSDPFPFCPKIIYCTPRSIPEPTMIQQVVKCIELHARHPDDICGFDLVGAEDRRNPVAAYRDILHGMQVIADKYCIVNGKIVEKRTAGEGAKEIKMPLMFHAGESLLDRGGTFDPAKSNVQESVLLGAKRIGHGFALPRQTPEFIRRFKSENICVELCPISNELLHLCRNVKEHPFSQILQAGIPCSLNSDNPSLFGNTLSHEFYQVMVGWPEMTLHGWKQLAWWSIEHSCLDFKQKKVLMNSFGERWQVFCKGIIEKYEDNIYEIKPKIRDADEELAAYQNRTEAKDILKKGAVADEKVRTQGYDADHDEKYLQDEDPLLQIALELPFALRNGASKNDDEASDKGDKTSLKFAKSSAEDKKYGFYPVFKRKNFSDMVDGWEQKGKRPKKRLSPVESEA